MIVQSRYEYWGPNGLQFTKWYNTNLTTKPRNKTITYSHTPQKVEYRIIDGELPTLEDFTDIPKPIKTKRKTKKIKS